MGDRYINAWSSAKDDTDRMCVTVDLSATLLHELTHVIGFFSMDSAGDCDGSYLIENLYRWAVFQRYSDTARAACCVVDAADPDMWNCFMSDQWVYIGPHGCWE